jgi:hypothetical protein
VTRKSESRLDAAIRKTRERIAACFPDGPKYPARLKARAATLKDDEDE